MCYECERVGRDLSELSYYYRHECWTVRTPMGHHLESFLLELAQCQGLGGDLNGVNASIWTELHL